MVHNRLLLRSPAGAPHLLPVGPPAEPRVAGGERRLPSRENLPVEAATEAMPCGADSFLAHLVAVPLVVLLSLTIAGRGGWPMIILIAVLALPLLLAFEYFSSTVPGRGLSRARGALGGPADSRGDGPSLRCGHGRRDAVRAFRADVPPTEAAFWLIMQIGLILGFLTTYPAVLLLIGGVLRRPCKRGSSVLRSW